MHVLPRGPSVKCLSTVPLTNHTSVEPAEAQLFSARPYPDLTHRPIPAPEPDPEPNPGPDAATCSGCGCIHPTDWDAMFLAIQRRLEDCVGEAMLTISSTALNDRRVVTKAVVLECTQAMRQLQSALTAERSKHQNGQNHRNQSPV